MGDWLLSMFCMFKMQTSIQRQKVKKQRKEVNKTVSERPQNCLISHSAYSKASFSDLSHPQTSMALWAVETKSLISHKLDQNRQTGGPGLAVSTPKFSSFIPVHISICLFPLELSPHPFFLPISSVFQHRATWIVSPGGKVVEDSHHKSARGLSYLKTHNEITNLVIIIKYF